MNKLFKLIGVAAVTLAAVLVTTTANAQNGAPTYGWQTISGLQATMTNGTVIATNFAYGSFPLIDCRKARNVSFAMASTQSGSGTSNSTYVLVRSVDGITWDTNAINWVKLYSTGSAGVPVLYTTNIDTLGYGYYGLYAFTNQSILTWTNSVFEYSLKISAP